MPTAEFLDGRLVFLQFRHHERRGGDRPASPRVLRTGISARALSPLRQARLPVGAVFDADPVTALLHFARRKRLPFAAEIETLPASQDVNRIDDLRRLHDL